MSEVANTAAARWHERALAWWFVAVVVAFDPSGWYPFGPIKWWVVTVGLLGALAGAFATGRLRIAARPQVVALVLAGVFALAAVRALDPRYAWLGTPERHLGVLMWLLLAAALALGTDLRRPEVAARGAVVAAVVLGAAATAEACGFEPRVFAVDERLSATMGSPAYLGAAAALVIPIAVGVAADPGWPRRWRALGGLGVALGVVALAGSGARAAWLGIAVAGTAAALARRSALRSWANPRRLAAIGVAAGAALAFLAFATPVGGRVATLADRDAPGGVARVDEWRVARRVITAHPVLGVGPEGYRIAFPASVDDAYQRAHGRDPLPDRAHAAPLDVAATGGALALAAWVALVALVGVAVWRALRDGRPWLAGVAVALVAHLVGQLLLFPTAELEPLAWLLAGVVLAATARSGELRSVHVPRVLLAAATVALAAALVVGGLDVEADRLARTSVQASAAGRDEAAYDEARHAARRRLDEVRLQLLAAAAARQAGRSTTEALTYLDTARTWSPDDPIVRSATVQLLVERAEATLRPDDIAAASSAAVTALDADPRNPELLLTAGRADRLAADDALAEAHWSRAESLAPRDARPPAELALLYADLGRLDDARDALRRAQAVDPTAALVAEAAARLGS